MGTSVLSSSTWQTSANNMNRSTNTPNTPYLLQLISSARTLFNILPCTVQPVVSPCEVIRTRSQWYVSPIYRDPALKKTLQHDAHGPLRNYHPSTMEVIPVPPEVLLSLPCRLVEVLIIFSSVPIPLMRKRKRRLRNRILLARARGRSPRSERQPNNDKSR